MISLDIARSVAVATLRRPPVNAINDEWISRLDEILDQVERDDRVNALWIRSAERVFCAGADLEFMRRRFDSDEGRTQMLALTRRMQETYARIEALGKVSLAEIGGPALGGGFELALACDLRIVADTAKVGLPEARLGLLPAAGGTQRMTRICGDAVARRLILGAEVVAGADAVALRLAHWAVPAADLEATARTIAERIAALPASAIAACKRCIAVAVEGSADGFAAELAASAALLELPDTQQRVRQFLDKQR